MQQEKVTISNFIKILKKNHPQITVKTNLTFKQLTTFRIGGKIKALVEITKVDELLKVLGLLKEYDVPYFILGKGSNLLVSDKPCKYVILKIMLNTITVRKNKIICGAGVSLFKLNTVAINNGLSGLEWSFGIPGSVGGAVKMNAGSFGGEMKNVVECVYYTDGEKIYKKTNKSLQFSYRKSYFSNKNYVVLKAIFNLEFGASEDIKNKCLNNLKSRQNTQPYNKASAGSVFKRPLNNFAPVLIERCNLKGFKCGGAEISTKHCGFIVNQDGNATFNQVFKIITKIKKTVSKKFGIILEEEIIILRWIYEFFSRLSYSHNF